MRRWIVVLPALALWACEDAQTQPRQQMIEAPTEAAAEPTFDEVTDAPQEESFTAILRCSVGASPVAVSQCLAGNGEQTYPGELKIRSGGDVRLYSSNAFYRPPFYHDWVSFDLEAPFELNVQANSDPAVVLRLEIKQGSDTVFQDEMSNFGGAYVTDENFGRSTMAQRPRRRRSGRPVSEAERDAAVAEAEETLREYEELMNEMAGN